MHRAQVIERFGLIFRPLHQDRRYAIRLWLVEPALKGLFNITPRVATKAPESIKRPLYQRSRASHTVSDAIPDLQRTIGSAKKISALEEKVENLSSSGAIIAYRKQRKELKMAKIERALVQLLREEINASLAIIAAKHGVKLTATNASFARDGSSGKFNLEMLAGDSEVSSLREARLETGLGIASLHFPKVDLTATYKFRGDTFKIVGFNTKARKTPFIVEDQNGKKFRARGEDMGTMFQVA